MKMRWLMLFIAVVAISVFPSCSNETAIETDDEIDIESEIISEDSSYYNAFVDYYDYACYVVEGDDSNYHHQQCKTITDENFRCRIYNKAEVEAQNLKPCSECWGLTPDEFLEEYYGAGSNETAYKDAAVEVVAHCAAINNSDNRYYHRIRCHTMEGEDFVFLNTEAAEADGYEPCPTCWGGDNANARIYITNTY